MSPRRLLIALVAIAFLSVGATPYDGANWTAASDLDIDHVVPLKNAWISGAWAWTSSKRESFANDLADPQLIAVTDNVNQAKGDKSPDAWKPPLPRTTALTPACGSG